MSAIRGKRTTGNDVGLKERIHVQAPAADVERFVDAWIIAQQREPRGSTLSFSEWVRRGLHRYADACLGDASPSLDSGAPA